MLINTSYNQTAPNFSARYYTRNAQSIKIGLKKYNVSDFIYENPGDILSKKSKKLFAALDTEIEETWAAIKKGEKNLIEPVFYYAKKGKVVTIRPVYGGKQPEIMMEVGDGNSIEKIVFNRKNPQEYRYEKIIETDHGCATVNSYRSHLGDNSELPKGINDMVEKYISKILSRGVVNEHFGKLYEL